MIDLEQEKRQTALFAQYGLAAAAEALDDAGFKDGNGLTSEMTVIGSAAIYWKYVADRARE